MSDHGESLGRGRRPRLAAGAITVAIAVSLAATGCFAASSAPSGASSQVPGGPSGPSGPDLALSGAPGISGFGSPASKIAPHSPLSGPPADPFSGTPADRWGDGAAGIVLPAAGPVGGYTAAQVESAYEKTRQLLAAAYLDRKTLLGGQPAAFASLLTSQEATWFLDGLDKTGVNKQGEEVSTRSLVMAFPPGAAQLIGSVIKVHGTMRAQVAAKDGQNELDIDTDYIFVYPVEPPHRPTAWMRVVAQASWTVSFADWTGGVTSFEPWVDETGGGVAGTECGTADGYEHPDYPNSPKTGAQPSPSGTPIDPYALGQVQSAGTPSECRATTGT
jgi:hypothetical protein